MMKMTIGIGNYIYHGSSTGLNTSLDAPFTLSNKASGSYSVPITLNVTGHVQIRQHTFRVEINGAVLGTVNFEDSGRNPTHTFEFTATNSQVVEGNNIVRLIALDNGATPEHIVWIDWIDVSPSRQFVAQNGQLLWDQPASGNWSYAISALNSSAQALDVTDPAAPKIIPGLTGSSTINLAQQISAPARYVISTTAGRLPVQAISKDSLPATLLQDSSNHADYIFISHPTLYASLSTLMAYRESEGYTVAVASVQDIFDEFNYGIYDTAAIQRFLAYTYDSWDAGFPGAELRDASRREQLRSPQRSGNEWQ